ncbi:FERM, ARHGEF and pleckstrin domain-containing protein 2-like [Tachypleus tridentatus]|uniref:FERM, ARHGEF and pleckstrin domain-containing protein 2-like n=1 Tax=Tachypleus tridentatus TaxID=6853 RepID=UPI003FCEF0B3
MSSTNDGASGSHERVNSFNHDYGKESPARQRGGKMLSVQIRFLDESAADFQIQYKALGKVLFEQVCKMLSLLEVDYFGLEYSDACGVKYWLDHEKPMCRQKGLSLINPTMHFCVKFYTPDPAQLEEEFTRYLFSLQIKQDLAQGILLCNDNTAALMASYIVQAESGDYVPDDYPDHTYLSTFKFVPHQEAEFEKKIMENHKKHIGQTPSEADLNLLETARRCELYGIKMNPAKDQEGVPLNLAVAHMGIVVFQNITKINTFSWAKIRKLSFRRKKFLIKLHPEGYGYYKDTVEFYFEGRNACKNFWKKCLENHGFFRCTEVHKIPRQRTRIFSSGSSFRYSGRTQKQISEYVRENFVKRQPFQRSTSFRLTRSMYSNTSSVGTSLSAHPLLPVSDSMLNEFPKEEVTPTKPVYLSQPLSSYVNHEDCEPVVTNGALYGEVDVKASQTAAESSVHQSPVTEAPSPTSRASSTFRSEGSVSLRGPSSDDEVTRSPTSPLRSLKDQPSSLSSPRSEGDSDLRRKKIPADKAYFIAKELLMTERTYKKDLELLNLWFRDEVSKEDQMPTDTLAHLFSILDPMYEFQCTFLRKLEQRLATWEGRCTPPSEDFEPGVGDILYENSHMIELYICYIENLPLVLENLNIAYRNNQHFEQVYREFELQKVCYLPLTSFLLRPAHRLLHYSLLLHRLVNHYDDHHPDLQHCKLVLKRFEDVITSYSKTLRSLENCVKLTELQHDLIGIDNLLSPEREFIREGCLHKLSRKGFQQRMFFLFSDVLLYMSRTSMPQLQFKVHGQLPLQGVMVEDSDPKMGAGHCFNIYGGSRALIVSASCEEEKKKWLTDLSEAIQHARNLHGNSFSFSSLHSSASSEELLDMPESPLPLQSPTGQPQGESNSSISDKHSQHRSNTTVHVCWHRNTSVGRADYRQAMVNYLSGYLLRKFKSSAGWQKLWVVFTNFCLFFYKSYQEDFPLASLPLLRYSVSIPDHHDAINKEFVFKLQFKNHIYFFRAESEYTFSRWMEVIRCATLHERD